MPTMKWLPEEEIWLDYTNHRGERRWRKVVPLVWHSPSYFRTEHHPQHLWTLTMWDVEKQAERTFALENIHGFSRTKPERIDDATEKQPGEATGDEGSEGSLRSEPVPE